MPGDPLRQFLREELDPGALDALNALLEPYYQRTTSNAYALVTEEQIDVREVHQALTTATQKGVKRLHFLSCSGLYHKKEGRPAPPNPEEFRDNLCDTMRASLGNTLWISLQANLRVSLLVTLQDHLLTSLGNGLKAGLQTTLGERLWESLGNRLWNSFWDSLFFFLGFTLAAKKPLAARLEPLIRLYPKCLPVDEKKDAPGVWLVLVA